MIEKVLTFTFTLPENTSKNYKQNNFSYSLKNAFSITSKTNNTNLTNNNTNTINFNIGEKHRRKD